jgi:hypothetical protein
LNEPIKASRPSIDGTFARLIEAYRPSACLYCTTVRTYASTNFSWIRAGGSCSKSRIIIFGLMSQGVCPTGGVMSFCFPVEKKGYVGREKGRSSSHWCRVCGFRLTTPYIFFFLAEFHSDATHGWPPTRSRELGSSDSTSAHPTRHEWKFASIDQIRFPKRRLAWDLPIRGRIANRQTSLSGSGGDSAGVALLGRSLSLLLLVYCAVQNSTVRDVADGLGVAERDGSRNLNAIWSECHRARSTSVRTPNNC